MNMFFLIHRLPRSLLTVSPSANNLFSILSGRYISSSEILQNSEQGNNKTKKRIGGLPSDLVNQQKLKKTSRTLSTLQNDSLPIATRIVVSPNESRDFMTLSTDIIRDLTEHANKYNSKDASTWLKKVLEYNILHGKKFRGLLTVFTYKNIVKDVTAENLKLAQILGWCLELLQCFFLLSDDIMDNSTTRRGQTCWHRLDNVGLIAFNDSIMVESGIYVLLKKYFSHLDCYVDLMHLFHEITFITTCGQSLDMLNNIIRDLTEHANKYNSKDASTWLKKVLEYNILHGKKFRGLLTVFTYKNIVKDVTAENLKLAQILGWCLELLQCFFLLSDDIMDNSTTRRGQTCWHRLDNVGLIAFNDSIMVESGIYVLLKKYFSHLDCYVDLMHLFHEITFITTCGQSLDMLNSNKSVSTFTMDTYKTIAANKTSHYTFYLPIAAAMHLAGLKDAEALRQTKMIAMEIGHFFQVQDDFLDCFGKPELTGKLGTDIQDNKCSWLAVVCMQRANDEQKAVMLECYGKTEPGKAARVKELYKTLGLPNTYADYEQESYNMIKTHIQQTSRGVPQDTFLEKILVLRTDAFVSRIASMFFLIHRLPRSLLTASPSANNLFSILSGRYISSSEILQNSEQGNNKTKKRIGGLPSDLVNQQKLKKTSRTLSILQNDLLPIATRIVVSPNESRDFMTLSTGITYFHILYARTLRIKKTENIKESKVFNYHLMKKFSGDIIRDLTEHADKYNSKDASTWLKKVLEYNILHGKKFRALLTILTYKNLVKDVTAENLKLAQILGWCLELLQCFLVLNDDIMDNSTTRRGQTCWHRLDNVGLIAFNDSIMVESGIYVLLKKYFSHLDCYVDLMHMFHEMTFITTCGQSLDMLNSNKSVSTFTMNTHKAIAANKTSHYTFYFPIAAAMHLAGLKDAEALRQTKMIAMEIGHFYQVQDDFLDCFGKPEVTGKLGTDIQDNKCSWLAVVCMQRANDEQKAVMLECYGKTEPDKVARVKELYKTLGLPNTYANYEQESYNMIKTHIQQTSRGVPQDIFLEVLNKIYQRSA
uniref:Farnesyl pyrophosphate synthase n=1 Tax=Glossina morsitans morsitans TaxID=37546 RepID=A0A1B0FQH8_GLOMM